jgi:GNAT superfamily N-acetyltransferase
MSEADLEIDLTRPDEADDILEITAGVGVFSDEELETVRELLDGYYDDPEESGYYFLTCCHHGRLVGYACWGPRDLSGNGYDLYWICAASDVQGKGIGRALMHRVEQEVAARAGVWIIIETSDTAMYAPARRLYERCGYQRSMVLPDFYHAGDGLVVYTKRLN